MTDLAALVVRMQADNSAYMKALDQATGRLSQFEQEQQALLGELAAKFAAAFGIDKLVEFAASSIESAASLDLLSQSAGISVEALSSLRLAAAAAGLSQDELGGSLKKLNVSISDAAGNASSKAGVAFRGLGIDVRDANGNLKDASQVLPDLANKFATMADGPNKVALAVALLGKQGQSLIPVLNQGAAGLDGFKTQAEAAGIVLSIGLAAAADDFSTKAAVLKATLVDGLGIQIATQLLPVLTELMDQFKAAGGAGSELGDIAGVLVGGFKIIAAVVIEGVAEFEQLGKSMGALGAIAVSVAQGNFSEAVDIWKQSTADNEAIEKSAQDRITAIFEAGGKDQIAAFAAIEEEKKKLRSDPGFNLAEGIASDAALKKLEQFRDTIKEQADAFGLGGAALVQFKLQTGSLADDLKKAGDAGKSAAAGAIAYATALQTKKDDKTVKDYTAQVAEQIVTFNQGALAGESYKLSTGAIGEALGRLGVKGDEARASILELAKIEIAQKDQSALQALDDQADKLAGNLNKAALAAYDLQNKTLKENLTSTGDTAGLDKLATDRQHIDDQSKINELNLKAAQINTELAATESKINLARTQGQISDLTASGQESDARTNALTQLQAIYASEQSIAAGANDPALVDGVKKFGVSIDALKAQTTQLEDSVRTGLSSSFANNFANLITGATSFRQAILGFLKDIDKQFADMIAKDYAQKLFAGASGNSSGGALGGLSGLLAGLIGGGGAAGGANIASTGAAAAGTDTGALASTIPAFASGGTLGAGKWGLVGEAGPELVYSGAQNMNVVPAGQGKQTSVTNHFVIQAPGGTISRASQMQTAAAAARSLEQANRRNNT